MAAIIRRQHRNFLIQPTANSVLFEIVVDVYGDRAFLLYGVGSPSIRHIFAAYLDCAL
jgi:hypothetical protein